MDYFVHLAPQQIFNALVKQTKYPSQIHGGKTHCRTKSLTVCATSGKVTAHAFFEKRGARQKNNTNFDSRQYVVTF